MVFKIAYTLTLAELNFEDLDTSRFIIFVIYTTMITLVLMNLLIAILSDAYELVQSEKKYYDGKAKIHRSLVFERLAQFVLKVLNMEREQSFHYLFVSMPINYEEVTINEEEGMIGKILNASRTSSKEFNIRFDENAEENKATLSKIDEIKKE